MDNWASQQKQNAFGQTVRVITMQSEGGAVAACHGSVASGVLTSTFTASQVDDCLRSESMLLSALGRSAQALFLSFRGCC